MFIKIENILIPINMESFCTLKTDSHEEWRNSAGKLHRLDGPALIMIYPIENSDIRYDIIHVKWYNNGKLHRENGPAYIEIDYSSTLSHEYPKISYVGSEIYIGDSPISILNYKAYWYYDNRLHRNNGPAVINNNDNQYWINGNRFSEQCYCEYKKLIDLKIMFQVTLETIKNSHIDLNADSNVNLNPHLDLHSDSYIIPKTLVDSLLEKIEESN